MGIFDFIFGNKKKEEEARLEREHQERLKREQEEKARKERRHQEELKREQEENARKERVSKAIQNGTPVNLLVFHTTWCGPSKRLLQDFGKTGLKYSVIDVEKEQDLGEKYRIRNVPTTILVNEQGEILNKWIGYDDEDPGQTKIINYLRQFGNQIVVGTSNENTRASSEQFAKTIEPFVFKSNCHQRYEGEYKKMGLQECLRTITVEKNTNGCSGYKIAPGVGYIVKIYNDDLGKPNMADKPMVVVRKTLTSVELRGYPVEAQTPFGWQEVDLSDYGLNVHYENGCVSKCALHMYDRNTFIEYYQKDTSKLEDISDDESPNSICNKYAQLSKDASKNGNTSLAQRYGLKIIEELRNNPSNICGISNVEDIAIAMGKTMEGDYFSDGDSIKQAVGLTYYMLCKAIVQNKPHDPYLYVYRFSLVWEYNKVFYHLFAHSEGNEYNPNPYDIFSTTSTMTYDHHMQGMQMADMLQEPRISRLDPALGNIFNEMYQQYRSTPSEQIISLGNKYHEQIFSYLKQKINKSDIDF